MSRTLPLLARSPSRTATGRKSITSISTTTPMLSLAIKKRKRPKRRSLRKSSRSKPTAARGGVGYLLPLWAAAPRQPLAGAVRTQRKLGHCVLHLDQEPKQASQRQLCAPQEAVATKL